MHICLRVHVHTNTHYVMIIYTYGDHGSYYCECSASDSGRLDDDVSG